MGSLHDVASEEDLVVLKALDALRGGRWHGRRRGFLGVTVGAAAVHAVLPNVASAAPVVRPGGAPSPSDEPDAELITVCNEYLRIQRAFKAYYDSL